MARIGKNPAKNYTEITRDNKLCVIIPVYIPNHVGYFKDSFEIFKMCLGSLHRSKSFQLNVAVILNGCSKSVIAFCEQEAQEGRIDELIILNKNIGKVNAILKGVAGSDAELFLVTDADVLFMNGFERVIYQFFSDQRAGFLGLQPVFGKSEYFTSWTRLLLIRNIRRVVSDSADSREHLRFQKSKGNEKIEDLKKISVVNIKGVDCVLGTGHFCFVTHRTTFDNIPKLYTEHFISRGTERTFLDQPSFFSGLLRLSVRTSVAMHMGNTIEPWMSKTFENIAKHDDAYKVNEIPIGKRRRLLFPKIVLRLVEKIF